MTQQTFIFRERACCCEVFSSGADHRKAEMEVSRLNFRDDGWGYMAVTGIFHDEIEARRYAQLRSKGMNPDAAMKRLREELHVIKEVQASKTSPSKRAEWRNPRSAHATAARR